MKMKKIYKQRRDFLIESLQSTFSNSVIISGYSTGLHLIAQFPRFHFTCQLLEEIKEAGVNVHPVEDHANVKGKHQDKLILGYGHLSHDQIKEGVTRLHRAITT